jgi:hypothetical protein
MVSMKLFLLALLTCGLWAQDASLSKLPPKDSGTTVTVNPEAESLKARIVWLESTLKATQAQAQACFSALNGQFGALQNTINDLAAKEPPKPKEGK